MVQTGNLDAFCTVPTDERRSYVSFCETPTIIGKNGLFYRKGRASVEDVDSFERLAEARLGAYLGNGWAKHHLAGMNVTWVDDYEKLMRMVAGGRIDFVTESEFVGAAHVRNAGLADEVEFRTADFLGVSRYTFGLRADFSNAAKVVGDFDRATKEIAENGQLEEILATYR